MLLANLWLCGTAKKEAELKGERVRARWALILILTLTMAIPVTWGIFHSFFPHLHSKQRSESFISQPSSWAGILSHQKKNQHMQRKICWQLLQHLLFSEVCVLGMDQSLCHAVLRVKYLFFLFFGQGVNESLCTLHSSSPLLCIPVYIFPIFSSWQFFAVPILTPLAQLLIDYHSASPSAQHFIFLPISQLTASAFPCYRRVTEPVLSLTSEFLLCHSAVTRLTSPQS